MRSFRFSPTKLLHTKSLEKAWGRVASLMEDYFRVEVRGLEFIPKNGPAIIISNHSGYAGADAVVLSHLIQQKVGRAPKILAHRAYFDWSNLVRKVSTRIGLRRAGIEEGVRVLKNGQLLLLFPEGESGNFKPSIHKYELQPFRTGFLRMAYLTGVPIIPCYVIGAEESFLNFGNINLSKCIKGLRIPLPVNVFPFPAKWKIQFLRPIETAGTQRTLTFDDKDQNTTDIACEEIRNLLQKKINKELKKRSYIYFPHL